MKTKMKEYFKPGKLFYCSKNIGMLYSTNVSY